MTPNRPEPTRAPDQEPAQAADNPPRVPGPLPENGTCDLDDLALLAISGEEAEGYLQGQLTCDVRRLPSGAVLPAAHLTPKGRAIATFLAWHAGGTYYLQFPAELADALTRRLQMFLLRSKARIERAETRLQRLAAWGPAVERVLGAPSRLPEAPYRALSEDGLTVLRLPGAAPRIQLVGTPEAVAGVRDELAGAGCVAVEPAAWRLLDIRAGLGWVRAATSEAFIPQMLNYDLIDGISFQKGCYVGQEVVARLHHLGDTKRRAVPAASAVAQPPAPGTPLHSPGSGGRQGAGLVVDAVGIDDGGCELLVVVERRAAASGALHLGAPDGPAVTLLDPPYPLPPPKGEDTD